MEEKDKLPVVRTESDFAGYGLPQCGSIFGQIGDNQFAKFKKWIDFGYGSPPLK
jgi:hypothetical protein